jgi:uncharacterized membrane protein (UPF0127 family)
MIRSILTSLVAMAVFALLLGCGPQQPAEKTPGIKGLEDAFERDQLVIITRDGARHSFDVYLALDYEQQRRGLMFVRELPEDTGMLFVYGEPGVRSMWMKNTYMSLDIVFAREDGTVSSVIRDAEPLSLQSLRATEPVSYVLELNAGVARRLGIGPGSQLIWESAQTDAQ